MADLFLPGAKHRLARMDGGACNGRLPRVVWHSTENDPALILPGQQLTIPAA